MELPERNNVYGTLQCNDQLNEVADIVRLVMSLAESEVHIKTSGFDDSQKILIRSARAEFDGYFADTNGKLLFNGAVAGSVDEVTRLIQEVHGALNAAGFAPKFEVYDNAFNCVAEFNS
jgi:hypothetical protein